MRKVEVFKTNIKDKNMAEKLVEILYLEFPDHRINFDLDDCDNVLRIEGVYLLAENIQKRVQEQGVFCEVLE